MSNNDAHTSTESLKSVIKRVFRSINRVDTVNAYISLRRRIQPDIDAGGSRNE